MKELKNNKIKIFLIIGVFTALFAQGLFSKDVVANSEIGEKSGCTVSVEKITGQTEKGEDHGRTNGCRPTFKFKSSGDHYCPSGQCTVKIECENGDKKTYNFKNPGVPSGSCPPGANPGRSGRYEEGQFLWKSKGDNGFPAGCVLAILLPKELGTGKCEEDYKGKQPDDSGDGEYNLTPEQLRELTNLWMELKEELHGPREVKDAEDKKEEMGKKMAELIKDSLLACSFVPKDSQ